MLRDGRPRKLSITPIVITEATDIIDEVNNYFCFTYAFLIYFHIFLLINIFVSHLYWRKLKMKYNDIM